MREGWVSEVLKEATLFKSGKTVSKDIEKDTGEILYTKVGDMNLEGNEEYITTSTRYVDLKDIKENQIIPIGSVIFPKRGGAIATNKKRRIISPTIVDLNTMAVGPTEKIHPDFLYYWFESIDLQELSNGTSIPQINNNSFDDVYISYPESLTEQKQIVAILDQASAAIDQAKANIEKNIENAKELFQSKLNEIFSQKGDGWEEKNIEEISTVVNGYSFKSNDFSPDNEVKAIKITNVGIMEFVEDSSNNLPAEYLKVYSKVRVHEGDLVLALTRTIISGGLKVARVPNSYHHSLLNQRVAAIVPNTELIDCDYLYYYFSSDIVYNYVLANVNTLMQPNLSIGDLKNMSVPITSIEGQKKISLQIESLSEKTNLLVDHYSIKLNDLEELKKSILQKAFAGELTMSEPMIVND